MAVLYVRLEGGEVVGIALLDADDLEASVIELLTVCGDVEVIAEDTRILTSAQDGDGCGLVNTQLVGGLVCIPCPVSDLARIYVRRSLGRLLLSGLLSSVFHVLIANDGQGASQNFRSEALLVVVTASNIADLDLVHVASLSICRNLYSVGNDLGTNSCLVVSSDVLVRLSCTNVAVLYVRLEGGEVVGIALLDADDLEASVIELLAVCGDVEVITEDTRIGTSAQDGDGSGLVNTQLVGGLVSIPCPVRDLARIYVRRSLGRLLISRLLCSLCRILFAVANDGQCTGLRARRQALLVVVTASNIADLDLVHIAGLCIGRNLYSVGNNGRASCCLVVSGDVLIGLSCTYVAVLYVRLEGGEVVGIALLDADDLEASVIELLAVCSDVEIITEDTRISTSGLDGDGSSLVYTQLISGVVCIPCPVSDLARIHRSSRRIGLLLGRSRGRILAGGTLDGQGTSVSSNGNCFLIIVTCYRILESELVNLTCCCTRRNLNGIVHDRLTSGSDQICGTCRLSSTYVTVLYIRLECIEVVGIALLDADDLEASLIQRLIARSVVDLNIEVVTENTRVTVNKDTDRRSLVHCGIKLCLAQ